jgi:peptide-methionine (S)-S-oxide reductase
MKTSLKLSAFILIALLLHAFNAGAQNQKHKTEEATFAMGCFWHSEEIFLEIKGVSDAKPGYCGGTDKNPTYEMVSRGSTRYAESVNITYDPSDVSYEQLLKVFFTEHDPTTPNFSYPDEGPQYRSMVFYHTPDQKLKAENYIASLKKSGRFKKPIITGLEPFKQFYMAESYHLHYFRNHPDQGYISSVTRPEVERFRKDFPELVKK